MLGFGSATYQGPAAAPAPHLAEPHRLHPMTLIQRVVVSLPGMLLLLLPFLRNPSREAWFSLGMALLYGLISLPAILLQYLRFRYWVTEEAIVIHSGVLTYKVIVSPAGTCMGFSGRETTGRSASCRR